MGLEHLQTTEFSFYLDFTQFTNFFLLELYDTYDCSYYIAISQLSGLKAMCQLKPHSCFTA